MSSPLDRIEGRLRACQEDKATRPYGHPIAVGWYAEDVLALVNVAKAAEHLVELRKYDRGPYYDKAAWTSLREALAALGKEPA